MITRHFGVLRHEGQFELMNDVIAPFVHEIVSLIVDIDISASLDCRNVSQVFDRSIGVIKRRRIEMEIASLREFITSRLKEKATEEEIGLRLAFLILGKDPLMGMLGESLYRLLEDNPGRRLTDVAYPEILRKQGSLSSNVLW